MSSSIDKVQMDQLAHVVITIAQIGVFLFVPQLYRDAMEGIDGPPVYAALRLIGAKEIGLTCIYVAGILTNDRTIAWMTVVGRSTTLVAMPYTVAVFGAPYTLLLGVIQDVLGLSATAYFLLTTKGTSRRTFVKLSGQSSRLPQAVLFVTGVWELYNGWVMFTSPTDVDVAPKPVYGHPRQINIRMFGYMTVLLGGYQIFNALSSTRDGLVYLAFVVHHLVYYLTTYLLLHAITGEEFNPPIEHVFSSLLIWTTLIVAYVSDRAREEAIPKKKQ